MSDPRVEPMLSVRILWPVARLLGEASRLLTNYTSVLDEGGALEIGLEGDFGVWRYRPLGGVMVPAVVNDFVVATAVAFSRRNSSVFVPPVEVHFMHEKPAYFAAYEEYLHCPVRLGAAANAIFIRKERLQVPMREANPALLEAFDMPVQRLLSRMRGLQSCAGRVHADVAAHIGTEAPSMRHTAKRLGMGVATLRRKLQDEGTSFSVVLDGLRRELAESHLTGGDLTISEVAKLLAFADVRSFARAFKRWIGLSPTDYRVQRQA